jgi:hypothetical protein
MERDYFAEPEDVTLEYRKRVKTLPRTFLVVTFVWVAVALVVSVFGTAWQLVGAIGLVAIIVYFGSKLSGDRKLMAAALKRGAIVRRVRMTDDSIELIDEASGNEVLERTAVSLAGLVDVRVARDWIGIYSVDPEFCTLELRNKQFRDLAARRAFVVELLSHLESDGRTGEHDEPYNPWIGKL